MRYNMQIRRGTAAQWASLNPVLSAGEPGFETDTSMIKVGNGTTPWNSLKYFSIDGGNIDAGGNNNNLGGGGIGGIGGGGIGGGGGNLFTTTTTTAAPTTTTAAPTTTTAAPTTTTAAPTTTTAAPQPRTLYFNGAVDNDWDTLGNWWSDGSFTEQASSLPSSIDSVIVSGNMNGNNIYVENITFDDPQYLGLQSNSSVFVSGVATFNGSSYNTGTIYGNAIFNDFSYNSSGSYIRGSATFNDNSYNGGNVGDIATVADATFNDSSYNSGTVSGNATFTAASYGGQGNAPFDPVGTVLGLNVGHDVVFSSPVPVSFTLGGTEQWSRDASNWVFDTAGQNWAFYESSSNGFSGSVNGDATFTDSSWNDGAVAGDANFYSYSNNGGGGTVGGDAQFSNLAINWGSVTGDATFSDYSYNGGSVTGDATFNGSAYTNDPTGSVSGSITFPYSVEFTVPDGFAWLAETTSWVFSGGATWVFNNAENMGILYGDATFNGTELISCRGNLGVINGNATFNGTSCSGGQNGSGTINGNAVFNESSYNNGSVSGDVTFNGALYGNDPTGSHGGAVTFNNYVEFIGNLYWETSTTDWLFNNGASWTFNEYGQLRNSITGNATFNDSSVNEGGTVIGNAEFNNNSYNNGTITGDATFNDNSSNNIAVTGTATFNDSACNNGTAGAFVPDPPPSC